MFYKILLFFNKITRRIIWKFYAEEHLRAILSKIGEYKKKNIL